MDLSAGLERSRSGRGGHVRLFFDEAKGALTRQFITPMRRLGAHVYSVGVTVWGERECRIGTAARMRFAPFEDYVGKRLVNLDAL